mmetsp:Transcript_111013/g.353735  ORF Transcript_111013/g.353735 Transcript_111013/m.353735 type:complete len:233 (+) Transcript_111013:1809-2507(+)
MQQVLHRGRRRALAAVDAIHDEVFVDLPVAVIGDQPPRLVQCVGDAQRLPDARQGVATQQLRTHKQPQSTVLGDAGLHALAHVDPRGAGAERRARDRTDGAWRELQRGALPSLHHGLQRSAPSERQLRPHQDTSTCRTFGEMDDLQGLGSTKSRIRPAEVVVCVDGLVFFHGPPDLCRHICPAAPSAVGRAADLAEDASGALRALGKLHGDERIRLPIRHGRESIDAKGELS